MKISSIKFNTLYNYNYSYKHHKNPLNSVQNVKFNNIFFGCNACSYDFYNEQKFSEKFFSAHGKPSDFECKNIIENHPITLSKARQLVSENSKIKLKTSKSIHQTPKQTAKAAICLKNLFDSTFGSYRVVSIGTSPAAITEAMQHLGVEVIFVPVSSIGDIHTEKVSFLPKIFEPPNYKNVKIVLDYFKSKVQPNDKKNNILLDFTVSGKSLRAIMRLLAEDSEIDACTIKRVSLLDILADIKNNPDINSSYQISGYDLNEIAHDCYVENVEKIANVPHFDVKYDLKNQEMIKKGKTNYISSKFKRKNQIFKEFEAYSSPLARAYNLCTYYELYKMELLKNI